MTKEDSEPRALARMVKDKLGNGETENGSDGVGFGGEITSFSVSNSTPLFERGGFYDGYSAKRNKRLKKNKGETMNGSKTRYNLGVTVESSKRRKSKKLESLRKLCCLFGGNEQDYSDAEVSPTKHEKENKKPILAAAAMTAKN